jgi:hypothetical protein
LPEAASISRATKVTTASATVVRLSGQKPRRRLGAELNGKPQAAGGHGRLGNMPAVGTGEGEVDFGVAGDNLGGEAVEPLALRVAEEPGGHGGLPKDTCPRRSHKRMSARKLRRCDHDDTKAGFFDSRKLFSE